MSVKILVPVLVLVFVLLAIGGYQLRSWLVAHRSIAVADVVFPCIRIYDGNAWEGIENVKELESMPSTRYMNRRSDPLLIDSKFRILEITNLKSRGSELGLIFSGPSRIRVTFELRLQASQSEDRAKSLLLDHIVNDQADGGAEFRNQLRSQASIQQMLDLLRNPKDSP